MQDQQQIPGFFSAQVQNIKKKRTKQEDRVVMGLLSPNEADAFARSDKQQVLTDCFHQLSEEAKKLENLEGPLPPDKVGSTLSACLIKGPEVTFAYVGDSPGFLVYYDEQTGEIELEALYEPGSLHDVHNPNEKERVENAGAQITGEYVVGECTQSGVQTTRAIGDHAHGPAIIDTPEVITRSVPEEKLSPGKIAFVMLTSDGIHHDSSNPAAVKKLVETAVKQIQKAQSASPSSSKKSTSALSGEKLLKELPQALTGLAHKRQREGGGQSDDDCSVVITPIEAKSNKVKVLAVADGHGGSKISKMIAERFMMQLRASLTPEKQIVQKQTPASIVKGPITFLIAALQKASEKIPSLFRGKSPASSSITQKQQQAQPQIPASGFSPTPKKITRFLREESPGSSSTTPEEQEMQQQIPASVSTTAALQKNKPRNEDNKLIGRATPLLDQTTKPDLPAPILHSSPPTFH